jgi:hypothetical protein
MRLKTKTADIINILYHWFGVGEGTFQLHHLIFELTPARLGILPLSHRQVIGLFSKKKFFSEIFSGQSRPKPPDDLGFHHPAAALTSFPRRPLPCSVLLCRSIAVGPRDAALAPILRLIWRLLHAPG